MSLPTFNKNKLIGTSVSHNLFNNLKHAREYIGYVPEGSPLYNEMTTIDFLNLLNLFVSFSEASSTF